MNQSDNATYGVASALVRSETRRLRRRASPPTKKPTTNAATMSATGTEWLGCGGGTSSVSDARAPLSAAASVAAVHEVDGSGGGAGGNGLQV